MDRSKIGVLEEGDEAGLSSLLESHDGRGLEAQIRLKTDCGQHPAELTTSSTVETLTHLEVLGNFTNKPLERKLADK